jgi:diaminopimelate epimerase
MIASRISGNEADRKRLGIRTLRPSVSIARDGTVRRDRVPSTATDRPIDCGAVEFEKWQALGNDYVILERTHVPFELTPARVRAICAPHTGVGGDGILLLDRTGEDGCVATMRIFNPDGSESNLSGNGAREAVLYLRRHGWTDRRCFSLQTRAGEIRANIESDRSCTIEMGLARLRSDDYPDGDETGIGELVAGERVWHFRHVAVGNPQCAIAVQNPAELQRLDLSVIGPEIERNPMFPNRTNVSWYVALEAGRIGARIFERGVGETTASGTGATGAAVSHVLDGGRSPVTVVLDGGELEVEVSSGLQISLRGAAEPVFRGAIAPELMEELRATQ